MRNNIIHSTINVATISLNADLSCSRSLHWDGFSLMTRIAEMYADRDSNDVDAHCETLSRVADNRNQNRANKEPMMKAISSALDSISTSIENANFGSFSNDGGKMSDVIKAVSDTIKTIDVDEALTARFYQSILKMWDKKGRRKGIRPGKPDIGDWDWDDDFDEDDDDDEDHSDQYDEDDNYYGDNSTDYNTSREKRQASRQNKGKDMRYRGDDERKNEINPAAWLSKVVGNMLEKKRSMVMREEWRDNLLVQLGSCIYGDIWEGQVEEEDSGPLCDSMSIELRTRWKNIVNNILQEVCRY